METSLVRMTNAASPPHRNILTTRWLRLGSNRNIRRFFVVVAGGSAPGLERRLQPIAALGRTRATRELGGLSRHGGRGKFFFD